MRIARPLSLLPLFLAPALLAACQPMERPGPDRPGAQVKLEGEVFYRERIALPPEARIQVQVADVSLADAPSKTLGETEFAANGRQVPIPFSVTYDRSQVRPNGTYAVSARITDAGGKLIWITDTRINLPPPGARVTLPLVRVP